jgi:ABC-type branched-subunit amino acid transport system substrate-binding protein
LGPLFAQSVPAVAQLTRQRGISVIAFSTDSSVAGRGVYLLSFLPESDVNRIVDYSAGIGKKSFAALLPDNAYGNVVEAAFKQAAARKGGRIVAFEKYSADRSGAVRTVAQALGQADALFMADDGDSVVATADALTAAGANLRNIQLLGTGLWDNPRVFASSALQGGLYAAPDPSGFRSFAGRYRTKFGGEPVPR